MISNWTKIDPKRNCFRFYSISLASDLFDAYVVSCEWGRIGSKRHHRKVDVFDSADEALAQVKRIEAIRLKHHYQTTTSPCYA
ncbi:MAG: WGR domain-containing protein [Agitococcus sp.]|nr:WGR domain-containing protein [Agitococcus sp.]